MTGNVRVNTTLRRVRVITYFSQSFHRACTMVRVFLSGHSSQWCRFNPRPIPVELVVDKVALGQVSVRVLRLHSVIIIPRMFQTHSCIYHCHYISFRSPYPVYLLTVGVEVFVFHLITLRHTSHSVGLLWTRDRPVAEPSTWHKHTQETNIHAPWRIRTHDLSKRFAAVLRLRPRGHWDRHCHFITLGIHSVFKLSLPVSVRCTDLYFFTCWRLGAP
jgi:hypothetical protein